MNIATYGDAGPAVVLIHGIPGSSKGWRTVAEKLAPTFRVFVPDLLGFGRSPDAVDIHAEAQARALEDALAARSVSRAAFIGHDFGGPVAMSLYRRRPQLFTHLGLVATNAFGDTPIPFPLSTVTWPVVGKAAAAALFSTPSLHLMLRRYGGTELGNARSVRRIFSESLRELSDLYAGYPDILASVRVPTLVVWGGRDPFFEIAAGRRLADTVAGSTFVVYENVGHFIPETAPGALADDLETFLR